MVVCLKINKSIFQRRLVPPGPTRALAPREEEMWGFEDQGCFFEIADVLHSRVKRADWEGENDVCSRAYEIGDYAVVRWASENGCYVDPATKRSLGM